MCPIHPLASALLIASHLFHTILHRCRARFRAPVPQQLWTRMLPNAYAPEITPPCAPATRR
jgi:hypothetical protein